MSKPSRGEGGTGAIPSRRRGLIPTPLGQLHYVAVGGPPDVSVLTPVLCFHMSPRSVDEYAEAATLLSGAMRGSRMVVAIDEFGYGSSDSPTRSCNLDEIADCMILAADHLGIGRFVAAGSLMGNCFALSLASRRADRVKGVICTNLYHFPDAQREEARKDEAERRAGEKEVASGGGGDAIVPIDDPWTIEEDGSHISKLWSQRSSFLEPDLNTRVVSDQLTYLIKRRERYARGAYIQDGAAFDLEAAARGTSCPVLLIKGVGATTFFDAIGMDMSGQFDTAVKFFDEENIRVVDVENPGSINLINQNTAEWVRAVLSFLDEKQVDEH